MPCVSPNNSKAVKELIEAGIIPKECRYFEMVMEPFNTIKLRYEVYATQEQVQKIADALIRNPKEARAMARLIAFPKRGDSEVSVSVEV